MLRVVRTDLYGDSPPSATNQSLSAVWIKSDDPTGLLRGIFASSDVKSELISYDSIDAIVRTYLRSVQVDVPGVPVGDFLAQSIIIEQSPPIAIPFGELLKKGTSVGVGTFIGVYTSLAVGNPMLLFLTVPAGVLIMGPAIGISVGLEKGITQYITEFFKRQSKKL